MIKLGKIVHYCEVEEKTFFFKPFRDKTEQFYSYCKF